MHLLSDSRYVQMVADSILFLHLSDTQKTHRLGSGVQLAAAERPACGKRKITNFSQLLIILREASETQDTVIVEK